MLVECAIVDEDTLVEIILRCIVAVVGFVEYIRAVIAAVGGPAEG